MECLGNPAFLTKNTNDLGLLCVQKPHNNNPPCKKGCCGAFRPIRNKRCPKTVMFLTNTCLKRSRFGPSRPNPLFWPCHGIKDPTWRAGDAQKGGFSWDRRRRGVWARGQVFFDPRGSFPMFYCVSEIQSLFVLLHGGHHHHCPLGQPGPWRGTCGQDTSPRNK